MKQIIAICFCAAAMCTPSLHAKEIPRVIEGKPIRTETVRVVNHPYLNAAFIGTRRGNLLIHIRQLDRRELYEKVIYEKLVIYLDSANPGGSGRKEFTAGDTVDGEVVRRYKIFEMDPLKDVIFKYGGARVKTDFNGIIEDREQVILQQFDHLRTKEAKVTFDGGDLGSCSFTLTRADLYKELDLRYEAKEQSVPQFLKSSFIWGQHRYRSGSAATLTLHVENTSKKGTIIRLLGRTVSRWSWLDGKMFYVGDLKPGQKKTVSRRFEIPDELDHSMYFMRIGFNDLSGKKPQIPVTLMILQTTKENNKKDIRKKEE